MKRNFIAKRFQSAGTGLTLDTAALAKYKDIVDLSIGDTDFTTDEAIINAAFRDAKAGHTHYGDPKGDPELISAVCKAWEEDFDQSLPRDHVLVSASSCLGMSLAMFAILDPGDEVIVFSPYFALYRAQIELAKMEDSLFELALAHRARGGTRGETVRCDIQTLTAMFYGYKRPTYLKRVERLQANDTAVRILEDIIPIEQPYFSDYF